MERFRILVVDDETYVARALARMLETDGYDVELAFSAREALTLMESESFDLVTADLNMPEMNGLEFLAWVSDLYPATRRVVITGIHDFNLVLHQLLQAGLVHGRLAKPCSLDGLLRLVDQQVQAVKAQREVA